MTNEVEQLYTYLLAIYIPSFVNELFQFFTCLSWLLNKCNVRVFTFYGYEYLVIYIYDNYFAYYVTHLFFILTMSFEVVL